MTISDDNAAWMRAEEVQARLDERLKKYEGRSTFEQFALFMGMAQLLELGLKNLLVQRFGADADDLERATLGRVRTLLTEKGVRPDLIHGLGSVVTYRNHMAHSFIADMVVIREVYGRETRLETRELDKGIYALESLMLFVETVAEHDGWMPVPE
jgi:hypothetical protein